MTLYELGIEYLEECEAVKKRIKELKAEAKISPPKRALQLRGRILSLYENALSLRLTGDHLINYRKGTQNEQNHIQS